MKKDLSSTVGELNSNDPEQANKQVNVSSVDYPRNANVAENEYNDQSMLDLCNDRSHKSAVEQHNDELGEVI